MRTNSATTSARLALTSTTALALLATLGALAGETHGDSVEGKRLFLADGCYQCHGTTGAGGGIAGPRLTPNPPPLEAVTAKLRTPSGRMPVYTAMLISDAQIADIVAYLRRIPSGKPAAEIPLLNR